MREDLLSHSFVPWKFHPKTQVFEPDLTEDRTYIHVISFEHSRRSSRASSDESYTLTISEDGNVLITFLHPLGGIRTLSTFMQMFYKHSEADGGVYTPYAPLAVEDTPEFAHRGLNLDISRNIIAPKEVMRTIEALAFNKFNRLHLHASDAQSWPLEIPALPHLAAKGAYHEDQVCTCSNQSLPHVHHSTRREIGSGSKRVSVGLLPRKRPWKRNADSEIPTDLERRGPA